MKTDAKRVIQMIVDYHLRRMYDLWEGKGWKKNKDGTTTFRGLLFDIEIEGKGRSKCGDIEYYRDACYMMFCSGVSVFWTEAADEEGDKIEWEDIDTSKWKNTSNHDSCWRTDGFTELNKQYYSVLEALEKRSLENIEAEIQFGVFGDTYPEIVDITLKDTPDGKYEVIKIERVKEE